MKNIQTVLSILIIMTSVPLIFYLNNCNCQNEKYENSKTKRKLTTTSIL